MKERMGENKVESQADSYVDKILIADNSLTGLWSSSSISSALSPTPSPHSELLQLSSTLGDQLSVLADGREGQLPP